MHATSNVHIMACAMWKDYIDSSSTGTVLKMQSKAHRQWVIDNRLYLHRVIDAVLYLSRQGLTLRGDDESEDFQNCGNFLELIDLIKSIDPNFCMQNAKMPDNGKYTSAEIQNELLNIAASQIRQRICGETNDAGFMSIMVDESKDVSRKEQMSLCIRYVSRLDFDIHEEPFIRSSVIQA